MSNNPNAGVDPELLPLLTAFPSLDLTPATIVEVRAMISAPADPGQFPPEPDMGEQTVSIVGADGAKSVELLIYTPRGGAARKPLVLHMHAGGFVLGSARDARPAHVALAKSIDAIIVSVEYGLAPETRYPGQLSDCYAALKWVRDSATQLGGDSARLAVMGESAGGGLAASLALLARDKGEVDILHQHLIYPMLDDRTGIGIAPDQGLIWSAANNRFGWESYLPQDGSAAPYAAAARAEDVSRLPSTYIGVGALDLFAAENLAFARRLVEAQVPVELHLYPGAFHGFDMMPDAGVTKAAQRNSHDALRRALAPQ